MTIGFKVLRLMIQQPGNDKYCAPGRRACINTRIRRERAPGNKHTHIYIDTRKEAEAEIAGETGIKGLSEGAHLW